ncbi:MAG: hypothetical protein PVSMB9_09550 [Candidatus Dormibacteria bacterium]
MEEKPEEIKPQTNEPQQHESFIERVGDELESRFIAAAEVATGTTSAETNLATAALRAIEGPEETPTPEVEPHVDEKHGANK